MSTANAIQLASNIQSKVGSSLLSVNSMLTPPEAAAATLTSSFISDILFFHSPLSSSFSFFF